MSATSFDRVLISNLLQQNEKFEVHTRKLSSEVVILTECKLELEKQVAFLETRISSLESQQDPIDPFRKPTSMNRRSMVHNHGIGSDLHMEDEEGEVFNNTYLADMKSGRGSEYCGRESIRFEISGKNLNCSNLFQNSSIQEIQKRNSQAAPHLRSSYLPQYCLDDDLKVSFLKDQF